MKVLVTLAVISMPGILYATEFPITSLSIDLSGLEFIAGAFVVGCASVWGIRKALTVFNKR